MPANGEVLSRLKRTMQSMLRIGNFNLKDDTGIVQIRNADDTSFADLAAKVFRFQGNNPVNAVTFTAPGGLGSDLDFVLPGSDGTGGHVLSTDGAGNLSFVAPGGGVSVLDDLTDVNVPTPNDNDFLTYDSGTSTWVAAQIGELGEEIITAVRCKTVSFDETDDGTPIFLTNLPVGASVRSVVVKVNTAAGNSTPTVTVGTSPDNDEFFEATDANIGVTGIYETYTYVERDDNDPIYVYVTANAQTFSGQVFINYVNLSEVGFSSIVKYASASFSETNDGSPVTLFTPVANTTIKSVAVKVNTPAGGAGGTIQVGTSGNPDAYFETTDVDLTQNLIFENYSYIDVGASPSDVIATITAGAQTFSGEVFVQYFEDEFSTAAQDGYINVKNVSGATITKGSAVYYTGAQDELPTIDLAVASDVTQSEKTLGVVVDDIIDSGTGFVAVLGVVRNIDTSAFAPGDTLYLSETTPGAFTNTKPAGATDNVVHLGIVLTSDASAGIIQVVDPEIFYEEGANLEDFVDVVFLGKHGDDTNDGLSLDQPVLTLGQAITVGNTLTTGSNRVFIWILDNGTYDETASVTTLASNLHIYGPQATVSARQIEVTAESSVTLYRLYCGTGASPGAGIYKKTGAFHVYADIAEVDGRGDDGLTTNSICFANESGGTLHVKSELIYIPAGGNAIGDDTNSAGDIVIEIGAIHATDNTGVGIQSCASPGVISGHVDEIIEVGSGNNVTGVDVSAANAEVYVSVNRIVTTIAASVGGAGSKLNLVCGLLDGSTAFIINNGTANAYVFCPESSGSIIQAAGTLTGRIGNNHYGVQSISKAEFANSSITPPIQITERSAEPTTPAAQDIYLDDGTNSAYGVPFFRRYTGTAWEDIGPNVDPAFYAPGRVSISSTDATPFNNSNTFGTLYYTLVARRSEKIALYDSTETRWKLYTVQQPFSLLTTSSGQVSSEAFDIFLYYNSGTGQIDVETVQWGAVNGFTRDTTPDPVLFDNVWTKSGDSTRRYIGTYWATTGGGLTWNASNLYVFNVDNLVPYTIVGDDRTARTAGTSGSTFSLFLFCGLAGVKVSASAKSAVSGSGTAFGGFVQSNPANNYSTLQINTTDAAMVTGNQLETGVTYGHLSNDDPGWLEVRYSDYTNSGSVTVDERTLRATVLF